MHCFFFFQLFLRLSKYPLNLAKFNFPNRIKLFTGQLFLCSDEYFFPLQVLFEKQFLVILISNFDTKNLKLKENISAPTDKQARCH